MSASTPLLEPNRTSRIYKYRCEHYDPVRGTGFAISAIAHPLSSRSRARCSGFARACRFFLVAWSRPRLVTSRQTLFVGAKQAEAVCYAPPPSGQSDLARCPWCP